MIWAKKRFKVLERDNFRCQYCWKNWKDVSLEVDHIIPKSKWWTDDFDNLITCCRECNIWKWDHIVWVDVDMWKLKVAEHEQKTLKRFFKEWNNLWNWTIDKRNLSFISWFVKLYYGDFLKWFIDTEVDMQDITWKEFDEWWEKCELLLNNFDDLAEDDLSYILDNLESDCPIYPVNWTWATDDYNERLNWLITYQMVWLKFSKPFIYKYSICPNKVDEWEEEFEEWRKEHLS